jgi:hypothetical protein
VELRSVWRHPLAFSVRGHEPSRRELSGQD